MAIRYECARCGAAAARTDPTCPACGGRVVARFAEQLLEDPRQLSLFAPPQSPRPRRRRTEDR